MKSRIRDFFIKLISIKVIVWFGSATVLLILNRISPVMWLLISGMVFAARTTEKIVLKYLERKNEE